MAKAIYTQGTKINKALRVLNYTLLFFFFLYLLSIEGLTFELKDIFISAMVLFAPVTIMGTIYYYHATVLGKLIYTTVSFLFVFYFILLAEYYDWNDFVSRYEEYKKFYNDVSGGILIIGNIILLANIFYSPILFPTKSLTNND